MSQILIQSLETLYNHLERIKNEPVIGFDLETTGLQSTRGKIAGWAIGKLGDISYTPVRHTPYSIALSRGTNNLNPVPVALLFKTFFENYKGLIVGHNIKFDILMTCWEWFPYETANKDGYLFWEDKTILDTMVLAHILQENIEKQPRGLKKLAVRLLNESIEDEKDLKKELSAVKVLYKKEFLKSYIIGMNGKKPIYSPGKIEAAKQWDKEFKPNYADVSIPVCGKYGGKDVDRTLKIADYFWEKLMQKGNESLLVTLEHETSNVLPTAIMELKGMRVDYEYFKSILIDSELNIFNILKKLGEVTQTNGTNWDSVMQLSSIATKMGLKLPNGKKTKTGKVNKKFDASTRKSLRAKASPEAALFLDIIGEYNKAKIIQSTFMKPILKYGKTGILHGSFNNVGTTTGRYSSNAPNLHNMPKKDKRIRRGFTTREGYYNFYLDYHQMEMRLAAHFTNCTKLIELFAQGFDPYKYLASIGESIPYEQVNKGIRGTYKTVGLAALYGAGEDRLSHMTPKAQTIMQTMFQEFPEINALSQKLSFDVKVHGYINLIYNRRRRLEPWENYKALNSLIQGSGAMIVKKALRQCVKLLSTTESSLFLQLHDEMGFEVKKTELYLIPKLVYIMQNFKTLVPLTVSVSYTDTNWSDKKEWKEEQ